MTTHSDVLRRRMSVTCGDLYTAYARLWNRHDLRDRLPDFLILMHQVVRASVPLMAAARAVAEARRDDPVCQRFTSYLAHHGDEERDHDVWLLDDLESAGISRGEVLGRIPPPSVASLVGAQYYWIHHHHPIALLGYMRLLEGNPPSVAHIERLQDVSGLPPSMFRTYRLHGELDPDHLHDLDDLMDSLPLSETQGNLIWISAAHTANTLASCLQEIESAAVAPHA